MNKNGLVAIVGAIVGALLVVIYHIVIPPFPRLPVNCSPANCIPVWVIGNKIQTNGVFERQGHGVIFWQIQTAGYSFPQNGIEFPTNKPTHHAPAGEFTDCNPMPRDNTRFQCNARGTMGTYGYWVRVSGFSGLLELDPFIINN